MPKQTLEIVRSLQPTGVDIAMLFRDEDLMVTMVEGTASMVHADLETVFVMPVERSVHRGADGLRAAWIDWLAPWESYRTETEELIDLGDRVAVLTRDFARRSGVAHEVDFKGVAVYEFRDGKVGRIEFHFDRAEGLEAVGLGG